MAHLVISNYNDVPTYLFSLSDEWTLYDHSDSEEVIKNLQSLDDSRVRFVGKNPGHNLLNYMDFIINNYECMPEIVVFLKSNIVGRHCSAEWLERAIKQARYAFLFDDCNLMEKQHVQYYLYPSKFVEANNSWYVWSAPHRYFTNLNDFLYFLYKDYKPSKLVTFSPGGCYVVERERILRHPKSLYQGLRLFLTYEYRPAEAFLLERSLNFVFDAEYSLHEYVYDFEKFKEVIFGLPDNSNVSKDSRNSALKRRMLLKCLDLLNRD